MLVGTLWSAAPDAGVPRSRDGGVVKQDRFEIEGKEVTQVQFKARLAELHGQEHWVCAETSDGGLVRYVARDAQGHRFQVVESSSARASSITRTLE
jgi:hypothetical protein